MKECALKTGGRRKHIPITEEDENGRASSDLRQFGEFTFRAESLP